MTQARRRAMLFDDGKGQLAPLNDLRASFDIRTGCLRTVSRMRLALHLEIIRLFVPPHIAALTADRHPEPINTPLDAPPPDATPDPILVINGRCPIPLDAIASLATGQRLIESESGDTIAALIGPDDAVRLAMGGDVDADTIEHEGRALLTRPWHVRSSRDACIAMDLEHLVKAETDHAAAGGLTIIPGHLVRIHPTARVYPNVTLDLENGPIVIEAGATIRPGATLIGPCYVGRDSVVLDQALIKPQTAIGPVCKVAGEVGGCIFQGYANKAHDGHLGDSWIGEWANLGAGTTNSNLLNTYGEVTAVAAPNASREHTGEHSLGAIIGDHAKTAICTRLMTGVVIHTGAMLAATPPVSGAVPAFTWRTDAGDKPYRLDRFQQVVRTVMGRRDVEPSPAYSERIAALHANASH